MPNRNTYTLDFRPETYWDVPEVAVANIKGGWRKKVVAEAMREDAIEEVPDEILADSLSDEVRTFTGQLHPSLMGGEYLPNYKGNEVEIACIELKSVMGDQVSVRARRADGRITYSIVDEHDMVYHFTPATSDRPLTLAQLIHLIDHATIEEAYYEGSGLVSIFRDDQYDQGCRPDELVDFVTVTSEFYPELEQWYLEEALEWYDAVTARLEQDEE